MRELKPITDAGEPGTIILVAADSGEGDAERFALPVTDELRDLVAAVSVPLGDSLDDAGRPHIDGEIRPGDFVTVTVTESAPHFLIADSGVTAHRRTRAGDMSAAGQVPTTEPIGVGLGLPSIGRPVPSAQPTAADSCGC